MRSLSDPRGAPTPCPPATSRAFRPWPRASMLIHRYVFRELAAPTLLGLVVYTSIFVVHRFFLLARQLVEGGWTLLDVAQALLFYLPATLVQTIPMSVLLGILIGFSRLSADSEITALRATGVSYFRLLLPTAVLALLGWIASAAVYLEAVPWANTQYVELGVRASRRADINREIHPGTWVRLDGVALHARSIDTTNPAEPWLLDVEVLVSEPGASQREHWHAERGRIERIVSGENRGRLHFRMQGFRSVSWRPQEPEERLVFAEAPEVDRTGPERSTGSPLAIRQSSRRDPRLQRLEELRQSLRDIDEMDRIDALQAEDPQAATAARVAMGQRWLIPRQRDWIRSRTLMEVHKKFAIPLACVVFALTGMPLGVATRRGGRPASFVISLGVITLWWIIYSAGDAWVEVGRLSPAVGAWLPDVVLAIVGGYLLLRMRRQQRVGAYRALRDGLLLSAAICLLLSGLLLFERLTLPEAAAAPPARWPPVAGGSLLAAWLAVVLFRDRVAQRLSRLAEALRRPRWRGWTAPVSREAAAPPAAQEREVEGAAAVAGGDGAPDAPRAVPLPARWLEALRGLAVFALLATIVFSVVQVVQAPGGLAEGIAEVFTAWHAAAFLVLLAACAWLQTAGLRVVKVLNWWLVTSYLKVLGTVLGSLLVLYVVIEYLDLANAVLQHDIGAGTVAAFFVQKLPRILSEMTPLAAMVAALVVFGVMTKFNETTALTCCGVSVYRLVLPVVAIASLLSAGAFLLHEYVLPDANARAEELRDVIRGRAPARRGASRGFALAEDGRTLYHYDRLVTPDSGRPGGAPHLLGLTVLRFNANHDVQELLVARSAAWDGETWTLRAGWQAVSRRPGGEGERVVDVETFSQRAVPGLERPDYFAADRTKPEEMAFADYRRYIEQQAAAGYPVGRLRVHLQRKLSFPAATFILVLVALPFAFTTGRRGALYGVGIAVILAVVYYAATALFAALGEAQYLPPGVAAWAPNVLFALVGVYMLLHVRT